jgi:hypothetical protein
MNKDNQKKKYNKYVSVVINRLKDKYGLSTQYIHQSLRGDRVSETSEKIVADYKILVKEVEKALLK